MSNKIRCMKRVELLVVVLQYRILAAIGSLAYQGAMESIKEKSC